MDGMYDAWLASPYTTEVEPPQCFDCGEWMECEVDADEDGAYVNSWCQACEDAS
jgi:hypothetical protein